MSGCDFYTIPPRDNNLEWFNKLSLDEKVELIRKIAFEDYLQDIYCSKFCKHKCLDDCGEISEECTGVDERVWIKELLISEHKN